MKLQRRVRELLKPFSKLAQTVSLEAQRQLLFDRFAEIKRLKARLDRIDLILVAIVRDDLYEVGAQRVERNVFADVERGETLGERGPIAGTLDPLRKIVGE